MRHIFSFAITLCVIGTPGSVAIHAQEQPADEESQLVRDMHDLMNIVLAMHLFAADHDGLLPDSLGETLPYVEDRTSWTDAERPKATPADKARLYLSSHDENQKEIPEQVTSAWIDEHTSYTYLTKPNAKLKDLPDRRKTVLVHGSLHHGYTTNSENGQTLTRYPLAMVDSHAESHPKEECRKMLDASGRK